MRVLHAAHRSRQVAQLRVPGRRRSRPTLIVHSKAIVNVGRHGVVRVQAVHCGRVLDGRAQVIRGRRVQRGVHLMLHTVRHRSGAGRVVAGERMLLFGRGDVAQHSIYGRHLEGIGRRTREEN